LCAFISYNMIIITWLRTPLAYATNNPDSYRTQMFYSSGAPKMLYFVTWLRCFPTTNVPSSPAITSITRKYPNPSKIWKV
jgi:hypothetical protein